MYLQPYDINNAPSLIYLRRWKTFMTKHVNHDWSSTIDDRGYGPMIAEDYRRLMESHGFRVALAKPYPLCFKVTKVCLFSNQKIFQLLQSKFILLLRMLLKQLIKLFIRLLMNCQKGTGMLSYQSTDRGSRLHIF